MLLMEVNKELVLLLQQGDRRAFAELVEGYKKPIYNLAYRMLKDGEEAYDIAQETFLRVFQHINRYDPEYKFSTWIFAIASRLCIDRLRKIKGNLQELSFDIPDNQPLPEEQVIKNQLRQEIDEAINQLPEKYRLVIILRHINELSYEEISTVLEIPINTVKTHLFRGREMLKQALVSMKVGDGHG